MRKALLFLPVVFVLLFIGCGGASMPNAGPPPPPSSGPTLKSGQWHVDMLNTSKTAVASVDSNLAVGANGSVNMLTCFYVNFTVVTGSDCSTQSTVNDGIFTGTFTVPGYASYTMQGNLTFGGLVVRGSFSGPDSGTFTAAYYQPFSGTYAGTLTGFGLSDSISVTVSQDSNFSLQVTGTAVGNGVVTNLSIPFQSQATGKEYSHVMGNIFSGRGLATAPQLPPDSTFRFFAIADDPTEERLYVDITNAYGQDETGYLTIQ